MPDTRSKQSPFRVRVENPAAICGHIEHMTIEELRQLITGDDITLACPACGLVHLSRLEIEELEGKKVVDSAEYKALQAAAESW